MVIVLGQPFPFQIACLTFGWLIHGMIGVAALPNGPFLLIEAMHGVFTYYGWLFFNGEFACDYTSQMDAIGF